ncbi:S-adenosylmethionine decarboxylase [Pseudooceanicola nitratireducens]|jgi:S-adenosylmethionine decarboxylase|uniref:S-adenosylmethionine decarboxylase n=1 Tax=Pseudooceanicola nitratireducens TaxID=517719 RepID=A0A1I1N0K5_9RHOB|nr:S-adenosylmethionine decarboxylase [Pseudooceanicola nitratireducens]SEI77121.1 S-adenosylmethionine decarboxylase [Pseudooceanicola nitratireducens]SFC91234.1 S-adenosylmethionine decarboxylase [Pseudooceanicola nitratireducens]
MTETHDFFTPGTQLLVDHRGGKGMRDPALLEQVLTRALTDRGLPPQQVMIQPAEGRDGVTGVALLSAGHVAVQSWADQDYMSLDLLVPGEGAAKQLADDLARALLPDWTQIRAVLRNDFTPLPPAAA